MLGPTGKQLQGSRGAATNPTVLFKVPSESAEEYDRGEKFENYKSIPSLEAYVLVY